MSGNGLPSDQANTAGPQCRHGSPLDQGACAGKHQVVSTLPLDASEGSLALPPRIARAKYRHGISPRSKRRATQPTSRSLDTGRASFRCLNIRSATLPECCESHRRQTPSPCVQSRDYHPPKGSAAANMSYQHIAATSAKDPIRRQPADQSPMAAILESGFGSGPRLLAVANVRSMRSLLPCKSVRPARTTLRPCHREGVSADASHRYLPAEDPATIKHPVTGSPHIAPPQGSCVVLSQLL